MSVPVVAIIGAGYAGLACGVELARAGVHVTVFERSHTLGGRARVVHKDHHWRVDNGQHILSAPTANSPVCCVSPAVRPSSSPTCR